MLEGKHNEQMDAYGNLESVGGDEFSAKEKLRDAIADGGEFNIICQNALSSSAISLKYEKTLSMLLLYTSQVKLLFLLLRNINSKHVSVTVEFVLK